MLILSRKAGETIIIDGRIKVTVMRVEGEAVKLGIEAPAQVPVHRQEVYDEIQRSNKQALTRQKVILPKLVRAHNKGRCHKPDAASNNKTGAINT